MTSQIKWMCLCCLFCCGFQGVDGAEPETIGMAEALYAQEDFRGAIAKLHEIPGVVGVIPRMTALDKRTRARVFYDLGCCYLASGDSEQATRAFQTAFHLDSSIQKGFFQTASPGTLWQNLVDKKENERRRDTERVKAAMRSFVIPGWGQHYRGYEKKGYFIGGATLAVTGYWIVKYLSFRSARNKYRATVRADVINNNYEDGTGMYSEFEARYRTVKKEAHRANQALGILGGLWGLSLLDSVVWAPNQVQVTVEF